MQEYILVLKALGEPTRLRILNLLMKEVDAGLCVCEIVDALQENQYNISRHLQFLAKAGLVFANKRGRWIYYRLKEHLDPYRRSLLQSIGSIPAEVFNGDLKRLRQRIALRVDGECVVGCGKQQCCMGKALDLASGRESTR
jgi:ArsR family transcriptional regulator